ncbi:MAG: response regulator [Candidatus Wildermuthbacteria bacterium]|nr:response regulator [Candidatus Wildermuthbacteria bacterium]
MKTILFIEDEAALQKTLGDALRQDGFEILSALDGEIGMRLAKEKKPDLVLLDLMLPKQNGFEVLRDLKAGEGTSRIPVIVLTNLEEMQDVQKVLELGATTYLVKSNYSLEDVVRKIKEAINEN